MPPPTAADALRGFVARLHARDWDALSDVLSPDLTVHWPHTGETFDRDGLIAVNRDYPGAWALRVLDVVDAGPPPHDYPGGRRFVFRDPAGNVLGVDQAAD